MFQHVASGFKTTLSQSIVQKFAPLRSALLPPLAFTGVTELAWQTFGFINGEVTALHATDRDTILTSRGLYIYHKETCEEIVEELDKLQCSLIPSTPLLQAFLSHRLDPQNVRLLRISSSVFTHVDRTRKLSLNIGFINSRSAVTHFGEESYRMRDGDVYLLDVQQPHSVQHEGTPRYLITYTLAK